MINDSGITPIEYRCLVLPDEVARKKGSIYIPEITRDREKSQISKGTLIEAGARAFDELILSGSKCPKVDDKVIFVKYAGFLLEGKDGKTYRLVNDKDIGAIIDEGESNGNK